MPVQRSTNAPLLRAPSPAEALRRSWGLFKLRPISTLSVAIALLTSLFAVCCGLGILAAPWFMCELFALQISSGTGRDTQRSSAWLWAGLVQLLAVLVLCSLAFLTLLALGPDVLLGGVAQGASPTAARLIESLSLLFGAGGLALALVVHFEHAPSILIDRGGSLSFALLESARLVAETGVIRSWSTSIAAHGLQLAPAVAATVLAVSRGTLSSTVLWGLISLPGMALCLALGQGMVVSSYLAVRSEVREPSELHTRALSGSRGLRGRGVLLWLVLLALVAAGPIVVSGALLRPASVTEGQLPKGAPLLLDVALGDHLRDLYLPDTALRLELTPQRIQVIASDGGGAGTLPLGGAPITRVRVARALSPSGRARVSSEAEPVREPAFAIEIQRAEGPPLTTWIDDSGVRLDDSLGRRFAQLLPGWSSLLLLLCLFWTALWMALALPRQARLRKELSLSRTSELARAFEQRALRSAWWLLPAALLSCALGAWAALR
ncbi:MAG: hypothetical protein JWN48_4707 [Myxococcaceae bacterium]|nr:hypothetical protein [Myxococcaceae bacterium]